MLCARELFFYCRCINFIVIFSKFQPTSQLPAISMFNDFLNVNLWNSTQYWSTVQKEPEEYFPIDEGLIDMRSSAQPNQKLRVETPLARRLLALDESETYMGSVNKISFDSKISNRLTKFLSTFRDSHLFNNVFTLTTESSLIDSKVKRTGETFLSRKRRNIETLPIHTSHLITMSLPEHKTEVVTKVSRPKYRYIFKKLVTNENIEVETTVIDSHNRTGTTPLSSITTTTKKPHSSTTKTSSTLLHTTMKTSTTKTSKPSSTIRPKPTCKPSLINNNISSSSEEGSGVSSSESCEDDGSITVAIIDENM